MKNRILKTLTLMLLLALLLDPPSAEAALLSTERTDMDVMGGIAIRQKIQKVGSILVSEPLPIDVDILDIICAQGIESPEDYSRWLKKNIEYKKDEGADTWSEPEETLVRKYGDCEDFAFLNKAFLRVMGYKPEVLAVRRGTTGGNHAICVFKSGGSYLWFDNAKLKRTSASSLKEFGKYLARHYLCFRFVKISGA